MKHKVIGRYANVDLRFMDERHNIMLVNGGYFCRDHLIEEILNQGYDIPNVYDEEFLPIEAHKAWLNDEWVDRDRDIPIPAPREYEVWQCNLLLIGEGNNVKKAVAIPMDMLERSRYYD